MMSVRHWIKCRDSSCKIDDRLNIRSARMDGTLATSQLQLLILGELEAPFFVTGGADRAGL